MSIYDKASLVLIPSGTKTSKVYSQKPTNGDGDFTFSRSTAATRVNASGNIEKETQNLLLQSNQFDTTWTNTNTTETSGQSGYDGTNDAWLLEATTTTSTARLQQGVSLTGVHTTSIYAKAGTTDWIAIQMWSNHFAYFDVANGVVGGSGSAIDTSIEAVGNGFYRCSITYNASSVGNLWVYVIDGNGSTSVTSGKNVYLQDAQLEQSLVARTYIETTTAAVYAGITDNLPRLDYSGGATCPTLLLEPQRTNLVVNSEYLGLSYWAKPSLTATPNADTSPEGVQNAYKLTATANFSKLYPTLSLSATTTYTASFWVKDISAGSSIRFVAFDQTNGTTLKNENYSADISTTEWTRLDYSFTTTTAASVQVQFVRDLNSGEEAYVYGFQLETGSYPTSYIPTYGSAVTRAKDFINQNIQALTSGLTEGTLFVEFEKPNTGENNDVMRLRGSGNLGRAYIYNNGLGFASDWLTSSTFTIGENTKAAWRLDSLSSGVEFLNGVKGAGGSGTAWSDIRLLRFNADGNGGVLKIKQILFFPTALTDQEAIDLTTI